MLFKEIELKGLFTFADKEQFGTGVYRKTSARKFASTINEAYQDIESQSIASINTEVEPYGTFAHPMATSNETVSQYDTKGTVTGRINVSGPEPQTLHGNSPEGAYMKPPTTKEEILAESGINPDKFDPTKLIAKMRARSWRNYTVTEYRGENENAIVTQLGALVGNEDFMETVTYDGDGNPIFSGLDETGYGSIKITFPEGVTEADYTGFMEAAIPDLYKRRVTLYRAQGMTGMALYNRLVVDNRPISFGVGKGVNRAAHLSIVKSKTRRNNRSRRASRVSNLRAA